MVLAQTDLTWVKVTSKVSTLEQDFRLLLRTILRLLKYSKREKTFMHTTNKVKKNRVFF